MAVKGVGFFQPQGVARTKTAREQPQGRSGLQQSLPQRCGSICRAIQLKAVFAGIAGAGNQHIDAGDRSRAEMIIDQFVEIDGGQGRQNGLGQRSLQGQQPIGVAGVGYCQISVLVGGSEGL